MLNQFKTALLVWLQTIWHSFLSSLCWALPKHFRHNYVYFCEYVQKPFPLVASFPVSLMCATRYVTICVRVFVSKRTPRRQRVGSLCPEVRDLLQWLMGFLCEAPQGAIHNHWARLQPRQACPSHEEKRKAGRREGGGKIFPRCPLLSLSSPLPIHPAFPS